MASLAFQEFCTMDKLKYKPSCTPAQCLRNNTGTRLALFRDGTTALQEDYTIVHNGRFHEVSCGIQDFKRLPEAVRRTHTHHHSGPHEGGAQAVLDFCKSRPPRGAGGNSRAGPVARGRDVLLVRRGFSRRHRGRNNKIWPESLWHENQCFTI